MTDTYGSLKEAIAEDIHEPSDATVVKRVVQSALLFYRGYRFAFSEGSDVVSVSPGTHTLRGALPPRIDKATAMSGDIGEGDLESTYILSDGRDVTTDAYAGADKKVDFDFQQIERRGVSAMTIRVKWKAVGTGTNDMNVYARSPDSGDIVIEGAFPFVAGPDGYMWSEATFDLDDLQSREPDLDELWDVSLIMKDMNAGDFLVIDQIERHLVFLNQLPAGMGGIDHIQVNNGGVWFTTQRQSLSTVRGYETTRTIRGIPNMWCWHHQTLMIYPAPNSTTLLKIDYLTDPTRDEVTGLAFDADSPDSFTNAFFYNGGELLRTRACAIYALTRVHDQEMANRFKLLNQEIEQSLTRERTRPIFARNKVKGYWSGTRYGRRNW